MPGVSNPYSANPSTIAASSAAAIASRRVTAVRQLRAAAQPACPPPTSRSALCGAYPTPPAFPGCTGKEHLTARRSLAAPVRGFAARAGIAASATIAGPSASPGSPAKQAPRRMGVGARCASVDHDQTGARGASPESIGVERPRQDSQCVHAPPPLDQQRSNDRHAARASSRRGRRRTPLVEVSHRSLSTTCPARSNSLRTPVLGPFRRQRSRRTPKRRCRSPRRVVAAQASVRRFQLPAASAVQPPPRLKKAASTRIELHRVWRRTGFH